MCTTQHRRVSSSLLVSAVVQQQPRNFQMAVERGTEQRRPVMLRVTWRKVHAFQLPQAPAAAAPASVMACCRRAAARHRVDGPHAIRQACARSPGRVSPQRTSPLTLYLHSSLAPPSSAARAAATSTLSTASSSSAVLLFPKHIARQAEPPGKPSRVSRVGLPHRRPARLNRRRRIPARRAPRSFIVSGVCCGAQRPAASRGAANARTGLQQPLRKARVHASAGAQWHTGARRTQGDATRCKLGEKLARTNGGLCTVSSARAPAASGQPTGACAARRAHAAHDAPAPPAAQANSTGTGAALEW